MIETYSDLPCIGFDRFKSSLFMGPEGPSPLEHIPEVESNLEKTHPTFSSSYFKSSIIKSSKRFAEKKRDPRLVSFYRPNTKSEDQ